MQPSRILVVDDTEPMRRLVIDALSSRGHTVEGAVDGVDAAMRLRDEEFDILVTDLQMPRMDGTRLAEIARQLRPGIGIIVMTGHPSEGTVLSTFKSGAVAYLVKPVDLTELHRAVKDVLSERQLASDSAESGFSTAKIRLQSLRPGWIEFEAPSHHLYVERFARFFRVLLERGVPETVLDDIRLAVQELGQNAVEWGNAGDSRRPIRISAMVEPEQLVLVIEDQGKGFVLDAVPDPKSDPVGVAERRRNEGKRVGGYGIAMARAAMDDIVYSTAGNTVILTKRFYKTEPLPTPEAPPEKPQGPVTGVGGVTEEEILDSEV